MTADTSHDPAGTSRESTVVSRTSPLPSVDQCRFRTARTMLGWISGSYGYVTTTAAGPHSLFRDLSFPGTVTSALRAVHVMFAEQIRVA